MKMNTPQFNTKARTFLVTIAETFLGVPEFDRFHHPITNVSWKRMKVPAQLASYGGKIGILGITEFSGREILENSHKKPARRYSKGGGAGASSSDSLSSKVLSAVAVHDDVILVETVIQESGPVAAQDLADSEIRCPDCEVRLATALTNRGFVDLRQASQVLDLSPPTISSVLDRPVSSRSRPRRLPGWACLPAAAAALALAAALPHRA
jgi:hypothetical protein